jgi:hypothetical protein
MSEVIFEKLSFLNFQKKFLSFKNNNQMIPRDFFAIEIQGLEQFDLFKNLIKWLLI